MSILVDLIGDNRPVFVDERTAGLGGSFYNNPDIQPYSPLPLHWVYDRLIIYPKVTLLDVGASTGCFTLLARLHPDMTVHAFEPVALTYEVLRENIFLNALQDKVTANNCAVGDYDGTGIMNVVRQDGGKGVSIFSGKPAWHKDTEPVKVDVVTIDTYCKEHNVVPHMIKSDCEGFDLKVLEGASETIQRYHPFILIEYSAENADQYGIQVNDMIVMLEKWGYTWVNPEGMDLWCVHRNWEKEIK